MRSILRVLMMPVILASLTCLIGCSGGTDALQPDCPETGEAQNQLPGSSTALSLDSGHRILGAGRICFDLANEEASIIPDRAASKHYDVTSMVILWVSGLSIDNNTGVTRDWHLNVWVKNPTNIGAYNVRANFDTHEYIEVVNYMGYTKLFDGSKQRPFINWISNNWESYDFWPKQFQAKKEMIFRIPVSWGVPQLQNKAYLDYKIDVCWPGPIKESPYLYRPGVQQYGTWYASVINGHIDIPTWDWQNDVKQVLVDLTLVNPSIGVVNCTKGPSELEHPVGNPTLHHYYAQVNTTGLPPSNSGTHMCRVTVIDSVSAWELYDDIWVTVMGHRSACKLQRWSIYRFNGPDSRG